MLYTSNYYGAQIALGIAGDELITKPLMEGFTGAVSELFTTTKVTNLTDDAVRAASTLDDAAPTTSIVDLDDTAAFYDDIFDAQMEINPSYEDFLDDIKSVSGEVGLDDLDQLYDNVYEPQMNPLDDLPTETGVKPIAESGVGEGGTKTVNGYDAKVNVGQQNKHIPGTNEYKNALNNGQTKSIMYGDANDIQKLLNEKAGTGDFLGTNKERVNFGKVIGQYVDPDAGIGVETIIGIIHYGKKGAHIVPARPN